LLKENRSVFGVFPSILRFLEDPEEGDLIDRRAAELMGRRPADSSAGAGA
jgi:hypothetical protein